MKFQVEKQNLTLSIILSSGLVKNIDLPRFFVLEKKLEREKKLLKFDISQPWQRRASERERVSGYFIYVSIAITVFNFFGNIMSPEKRVQDMIEYSHPSKLDGL